MTLAIGMACSNISTYQNHQDACNSFFNQSSKALQVSQTDEGIENYFTSKTQNELDNYLGKDIEKVGVGGYFVYKTYKSKEVDFRLPTLGLCDRASNRITENSYTLNLTWNFPWLK